MPSLHLDMEFFTRSQKTLQKKKVIKTVTLIQRDTHLFHIIVEQEMRGRIMMTRLDFYFHVFV